MEVIICFSYAAKAHDVVFLTRKLAINHLCQQRGNSGEERVFVNVPDLYSLNYVMQLFKVYDCVSLMNINEAHEEREKSRSM